MGRKSERLCLSMRFMVLIPVIIVIFPSISLSSFSYQALLNVLKNSLGWKIVTAETIITNGVIWTGDPYRPWANSLAISQGRLVSVGSLIEVQKTAGMKTSYVDLEGRFVTPGYIDSHVHFIPGGTKLAYLDMRDVRSRSEFVNRLQSAVQGSKEGSWVYGDKWNHHEWGGDLPEASWIDSVSPNTPVWQYSGFGTCKQTRR